MISVATKSHAGRRKSNEDSVIELRSKDFVGIAIGDGMGGHLGGAVASALLINALQEQWSSIADPKAFFEENVPAISRSIYQQSLARPDLSGMGSTIVSVVTDGASVWFANLGDSRAYLIRDNDIEQVSEDDTVVEDSIRRGLITEAERDSHPYKHALLHCIGHEQEVCPHVIGPLRFPVGSAAVICSDGLSGTVTELEILSELHQASNASTAAERLVRLGYWKGSDDNISVGIVANDYPFSSKKSPILPDIPDGRPKKPVRRHSVLALLVLAVLIASLLLFQEARHAPVRVAVVEVASQDAMRPRASDGSELPTSDHIGKNISAGLTQQTLEYPEIMGQRRLEISFTCELDDGGAVKSVKFGNRRGHASDKQWLAARTAAEKAIEEAVAKLRNGHTSKGKEPRMRNVRVLSGAAVFRPGNSHLHFGKDSAGGEQKQ